MPRCQNIAEHKVSGINKLSSIYDSQTPNEHSFYIMYYMVESKH